MKFLTKLLKGRRLGDLKSSAEFETLIPQLEGELRDAVERRDQLEAKREQILFSDGDLTDLRTEVSESDDSIATLTAMVTGARKRHAEALEAEAQAEHNRKMAELKKHIDKVDAKHGKPRREAYRTYHRCAGELAKALKAIQEHDAPIRDANTQARAAGRDDWMIPDPLAEARERYTELARRAGGPYLPANIPRLDQATVLPAFWPDAAYTSPFESI